MESALPTLVLTPTGSADVCPRAVDILNRVEQQCIPAGTSLLILRDDREQRILNHLGHHPSHLETHWTDGAIEGTLEVLRTIAGDDEGAHAPTVQSIDRFEALSIATETAVERGSPFAPGLVRCCCLAAQELRRGSSTGKLGPVRLRAKLRVARLIGLVARRQPATACQLAALNLYATAISTAQIADLVAATIPPPALLDGAKQPPFLRALVKAYWQRCAGEIPAARQQLVETRTLLSTADIPGDRSGLHDLYAAVLAREMARIDATAGFVWCADVRHPALRCSGRLLACLHGPGWNRAARDSCLRTLTEELQRHDLLDARFDLGGYAIDTVAEARVYREFPPLPWFEIATPEPPPRIRLPRDHQCQPE